MPLPSSVQSIALRFTKSDPLTEPTPTQLSHTQPISLESMQVGTNNAAKSVKIDSTFVAAFNNASEGTIFTPSIVINYGNDLTISTSPAFGVPNFVPRKITPTFSLTSTTINKLPTDSAFYLFDFFTTDSPGVLSYSSSDTSVAEVDSYGQVTLNGEGTTTISVTQAASNDGRYIAAAISTQVVVSAPPIPRLSLAANGVTIVASDDPIPSFPWFVQENPRGTGLEWFAIVDNSAKSYIAGYAKNQLTGINYFKAPSELQPVPFNNIVTTHMTDMSFMFAAATTFNQDISSWDTSKVTIMFFMFNDARTFNQPIGSWDTSNVTQMHYMFENAFAFNKPIGLWNTAKVTNMRNMFYSASAFNQNISSWQVYSLQTKPNKPEVFDTGATALLANNLPNWAMSAPAP